MNPNYNHPDDSKRAEELDTFIAGQLNGQPTPVPQGFPPDKADLVVHLVNQAKDILPDASFAQALEAKLLQKQALATAQENCTSLVDMPVVNMPVADMPVAQLEADSAEVPQASRAFPYSQSLNSLQQRLRSMKLSRSIRLPQVSLAALSLLVALLLVTVSTPPLRLLALEFIQVFQRTRSDQVGPQNAAEAGQTPLPSEEMIQQAERQVRVTATISEMEIERGFDLREPAYVPSNFELQEVGSPYPEVVAINYENSQTKERFFITQQRLDGDSPVVGPIVLVPPDADGEKYNFSIMWSDQPLFDDDPALAGGSPIGASAQTTPIQIGDVAGEYVEGTWQEISSSDGAIQGMQWVQDPSFRQIQWREGEMLFQVFSPNAMSQEELAAIARSLQ